MESTINAAPQISIDREKALRSHRRYWVLRRAQDIVFSLLDVYKRQAGRWALRATTKCVLRWRRPTPPVCW